MVTMTILLISVTALQVQKVSLTGLTAPDRATLDAVERLTRPAVSRSTVDLSTTSQRQEVERYDEILKTIQRSLDEGVRAAGIAAALMLASGLVAAAFLPAQPAQILKKGTTTALKQ
jgi:hypothetical protein